MKIQVTLELSGAGSGSDTVGDLVDLFYSEMGPGLSSFELEPGTYRITVERIEGIQVIWESAKVVGRDEADVIPEDLEKSRFPKPGEEKP